MNALIYFPGSSAGILDNIWHTDSDFINKEKWNHGLKVTDKHVQCTATAMLNGFKANMARVCLLIRTQHLYLSPLLSAFWDY